LLLVEFVESAVTITPVTTDTTVTPVPVATEPSVPIVAGADNRKRPLATILPDAEVADLVVDPVDPLLADDAEDPVPIAGGANVENAIEVDEDALNRELFDEEGRMIIEKNVEEVVEARKLCSYWVVGKIATQQTMCRNLFNYICALACDEAKDDTCALVDLYSLLAIKFLAFLKSLPLNTYFIENVYSQSGTVFPGEGVWPACFDDYVEQKLMRSPGTDFLKKNKKIKEYSEVSKRNSWFGSQVRVCICVPCAYMCVDSVMFMLCVLITMRIYVCRSCQVSSLPSAKSVTG
jgi:hypothetical protein